MSIQDDALSIRALEDWRSFFDSAARRYQTLRQGYYEYVESLVERNLPVVFDFRHLARTLDVDLGTLHAIIFQTSGYYRAFEIPKRTGGMRRISVPRPSLMAIQRWINREILAKQILHDACMGFVVGRSIRDHALAHAESDYAIKIDLIDFFPSIKRLSILRWFESLGYAPNVAFFFSKIVTLNESLPQGAPTSPGLANIISSPLDRRLTALATSLNLRYSRYADDIVLSGNTPLGRFHMMLVAKIAAEEGFSLNEKKCRWYGPKSTKRFVGLSVRQGSIRIPRKVRRQIALEVHYIEKFGLSDHLSRAEEADPIAAERLRGRLCYWEFIEPENEQPRVLRQRLDAAIAQA